MISTFTQSIDDFFIGQYSSKSRAPVHRNLTLTCQPHLVQLKENPLRPLDILHIRRGNLLFPIIRKPKHLKLPLEIGNILLRFNFRVCSSLNCKLFRGQTEGIPSDGMKNIMRCHTPVSRHDIGSSVSLWMSHVQSSSTGVWEHVQDVLLFIFAFGYCSVFVCCATLWCLECVVFLPVSLPFGFYRSKWIASRCSGCRCCLLDSFTHMTTSS
mmetsp:Transcript_9953/g.15155  ORF Transcript_9953/g.15155 Transcript_9953/m.15155 type:complete len:212 (+) Transcript_9953:2004-2639(+)